MDLAISEFAQVGLGEFHAQQIGNVLGEGWMATPRHDHEPTLGQGFHVATVQVKREASVRAVAEGCDDLAGRDLRPRCEHDEGTDVRIGPDARVGRLDGREGGTLAHLGVA